VQQVTDMIVAPADLVAPDDPPVTLVAQLPSTRAAILRLVEEHHAEFAPWFADPPPASTVCAIVLDGEVVGAVILELAPRSAETPADAALGYLVVARQHRGRGVASAAIAACVADLGRAGCGRVIAEWVASVPLYERLGFRVWRTRTVGE
jgi:GNAT superfamily N-acetyltransferase